MILTFISQKAAATGAVVDDESYAGEGGEGYCNVYVSADSTWTVTGDSTVSSLENEGTIVDSNGKNCNNSGYRRNCVCTGRQQVHHYNWFLQRHSRYVWSNGNPGSECLYS